MRLQRKIYLTLEVEFDKSLGEDYDTAYGLIEDSIDYGLEQMERHLYGWDEVQRVRFVDVEYK